MTPKPHSLIHISSSTNAKNLAKALLAGHHAEFMWLRYMKVGEFSIFKIDSFIEEEERHDRKILTKGVEQSLQSMSSGERKKLLLNHLLQQEFEVLILINPFDNLDVATKEHLKTTFLELGKRVHLVQIDNRISDALPFIQKFYHFESDSLTPYPTSIELRQKVQHQKGHFANAIPSALHQNQKLGETLVKIDDVSVSFEDRPVLQHINWTIKQGEFWQLRGPNGSGKSTLLNLITGDSHKGYGQNLTVFGYKKGSGESVWDIKKHIGYFSPNMVDRFKGYHSLENMLISGLHDSVGLYQKPTENEIQKSKQWLALLNLTEKSKQYFHTLSTGEKRLIMIARAMIKHPPLLILDEPTIGLDEKNAALFVALVNAFAAQSNSALIYVSHRNEPNLRPEKIFELIPTPSGSKGKTN